MTKFLLAAAAALALVAGSAHAADDIRALAPGQAPAAATLADLKGIIGAWQGPSGSAAFTMTPDNQVIGHLEISNGNGVARIEEIWLFRAEGASIVLSQKHFGPDMVAREPVEVWAHRKLVAVDSKGVYLENLTWVTDGDTLTLLVKPPAANGAPPPPMIRSVMKRVK